MGKKHVIFLGAGASMGSGYPSANELRLYMCSESHRKAKLAKELNRDLIVDGVLDYPKKFEKALKLFRDGGFASVDEFCNLAGRGHMATEIQDLKKMMRFALCLHNPEETFEKSEYYSFMQRLFKNDTSELREDVAVLTFNYDPYLEFLLRRAYCTRAQVHKGDVPNKSVMMNLLSSGLNDPTNHEWVESKGFCLLKLHGSIIFPTVGDPRFSLSEEDLFKTHTTVRYKRLFKHEIHDSPVPAIFPWEIINQQGTFFEKSETIFGKMENSAPGHDLYGLFRKIWERAKTEVQEADRVSFVGLSMHYYLNAGFRFLFSGKNNETEVVIANDQNADIMKAAPPHDFQSFPQTPACRVQMLLQSVAKGLIWGGKGFRGRQGAGRYSPTMYRTFEDFIRDEMSE